MTRYTPRPSSLDWFDGSITSESRVSWECFVTGTIFVNANLAVPVRIVQGLYLATGTSNLQDDWGITGA
jgi:hypothetical protein